MILSLKNKRWRIFIQQRRGLFSLSLLGGVFVLSLFADLICNHRPLIIKYNQSYYFPFLQTYPETRFGGDFETETDYKDQEILSRLNSGGNCIVWAPIRFGPSEIDFDLEVAAPSPPDKKHLLGTDDRARDILARLIFGFRLSMIFGLSLAVIGTIIGTIIGAVQGYFGGKIDLLGQRFVEIWSSLPELFLLIILSSIFEPSIMMIMFLMALMSWVGLSAYVRAEFLRAREFDFILSPIALGGSQWRVMFLHILPNTLAPILTFFPFRVSAAITGLASLDFLGLGVPSPTPSLGELLSQGKSNLNSWWIIVATFVVMVFMILSLNFIGEALQKSMDPKAVSDVSK